MGWSVEPIGNVLCVTDDGKGMSVTNSAEEVVEWLGSLFDLKACRVIYRDTMQMWDGIAVRDGHFAGFIPIRTASRHTALARAIRSETWEGTHAES